MQGRKRCAQRQGAESKHAGQSALCTIAPGTTTAVLHTLNCSAETPALPQNQTPAAAHRGRPAPPPKAEEHRRVGVEESDGRHCEGRTGVEQVRIDHEPNRAPAGCVADIKRTVIFPRKRIRFCRPRATKNGRIPLSYKIRRPIGLRRVRLSTLCSTFYY